MPQNEQSAGKFNITLGDVTDSQIVMGDYNVLTQKLGFTVEEAEQLRSVFTDLRTRVAENAQPKLRDEALIQAGELERAVIAEQPDPGRIRQTLRWFRDNAPQLAATVVSVVVNPLVGTVVGRAGQAIADQYRDVLREEL